MKLNFLLEIEKTEHSIQYIFISPITPFIAHNYEHQEAHNL